MRVLVLFFCLFKCLSFSFAQEVTFEREAEKYFNEESLLIKFDERGDLDVLKIDLKQDIMESDIMKRLLPVIDSVEYYWGFMGNYKMQQVAFPLMKNLKALMLVGYRKYNLAEPFHISGKLQSLRYDNEEFPIPFNLNQMANSLKILTIEPWVNVKDSFYFDFSSFDSLRYLKFVVKSCKSSDYKVVFPPNLYCLEWTLNPKHPDINIPPTVEILFLHMENNSYPPSLFQLPNLRFFSNVSYRFRSNIPLPQELTKISSLKALRINRLTENDIEIISQMKNLDTLCVSNVRRKIPSNIDKLKGLKYIEICSWWGRERKIGEKIKTIFPKTIIHYRLFCYIIEVVDTDR
jgi:hypothetical protein